MGMQALVGLTLLLLSPGFVFAGPPSDSTAVVFWQTYAPDPTAKLFISLAANKDKEFARAFLGGQGSSFSELGDDSGVNDFRSRVDESLRRLKGEKDPSLKIFLIGHGNPGSINIKNGDEVLQYRALAELLSTSIKKYGVKNLKLDLYVDSCFSGSLLPSMQNSFPSWGPVGITVHLAARGHEATDGTDFYDAISAISKSEKEIAQLLQPAVKCDPSLDLEASTFQSLGGHSQRVFWSNSPWKDVRDLSEAELETLLRSSNADIRRFATLALFRAPVAPTRYVALALTVLKGTSPTADIREAALDLLARVPAPVREVREFLRDKAIASLSGDGYQIERRFLRAWARNDPDSVDILIPLIGRATYPLSMESADALGFTLEKKTEALGALRAQTGTHVLWGAAWRSIGRLDPQAGKELGGLFGGKGTFSDGIALLNGWGEEHPEEGVDEALKALEKGTSASEREDLVSEITTILAAHPTVKAKFAEKASAAAIHAKDECAKSAQSHDLRDIRSECGMYDEILALFGAGG